MAVASVLDGQLVDQVNTTETTSTRVNNSMDKEAFLQLLVAQMKYQDPLEPTSNTEYVAQYAQFSQVEMMQNMSGTMDTSAAMALVGKTVTVETEGQNGTTNQVTGVVDYVEKTAGKNLLYINGVPYNYDNLVSVWSDDYIDAVAEEMQKQASGSNGGQETAPAKETEPEDKTTEKTGDSTTEKTSDKTADKADDTAKKTEDSAATSGAAAGNAPDDEDLGAIGEESGEVPGAEAI
ncbi:MAG: hypothetical protein IKR68_06320 [Lachnospiraceae bacterium]|nr:hypothetical protein [Lachnospiraceae bacterium]